eukprot:gene30181-35165_t
MQNQVVMWGLAAEQAASVAERAHHKTQLVDTRRLAAEQAASVAERAHRKAQQVATWRLAAEQAASVAERAHHKAQLVESRLGVAEDGSDVKGAAMEGMLQELEELREAVEMQHSKLILSPQPAGEALKQTSEQKASNAMVALELMVRQIHDLESLLEKEQEEGRKEGTKHADAMREVEKKLQEFVQAELRQRKRAEKLESNMSEKEEEIQRLSAKSELLANQLLSNVKSLEDKLSGLQESKREVEALQVATQKEVEKLHRKVLEHKHGLLEAEASLETERQKHTNLLDLHKNSSELQQQEIQRIQQQCKANMEQAEEEKKKLEDKQQCKANDGHAVGEKKKLEEKLLVKHEELLVKHEELGCARGRESAMRAKADELNLVVEQVKGLEIELEEAQGQCIELRQEMSDQNDETKKLLDQRTQWGEQNIDLDVLAFVYSVEKGDGSMTRQMIERARGISGVGGTLDFGSIGI